MARAKDTYRFSDLAKELISDFRNLPNEEPAPLKKSLKRRPVTGFAELMEEVRVKYRIGIDSPEHVIRDHWGEIAGPLAQYSHPASINQQGKWKDWVVVLVSHGVAREELRSHQKEILARIRKLAGCAHVRGIVLRAG